MLRIPTALSTLLISGYIVSTQTALAETVNIGSGHTRVISLSGKSKSTRQRNRIRRARARARKLEAAQKAAQEPKQAPIIAIKRKAKVTIQPTQKIVAAKKVMPAPAKIIAATQAQAKPTKEEIFPNTQPASDMRGSHQNNPMKVSPAQAVTEINPAQAKPATVTPIAGSGPRASYERYVAEIKTGNNFAKTMLTYTAKKKKAEIQKMLNSKGKKRKFAEDFIVKTTQCTELTFSSQSRTGNKASIHYTGKDICSKNGASNISQTINMIKEKDGWKIENSQTDIDLNKTAASEMHYNPRKG